jgi:hypothetical protein
LGNATNWKGWISYHIIAENTNFSALMAESDAEQVRLGPKRSDRALHLL